MVTAAPTPPVKRERTTGSASSNRKERRETIETWSASPIKYRASPSGRTSGCGQHHRRSPEPERLGSVGGPERDQQARSEERGLGTTSSSREGKAPSGRGRRRTGFRASSMYGAVVVGPWRGKVFPTTDNVFLTTDDVIPASASRHMPDGLGRYPIFLCHWFGEASRRTHCAAM
jgi:hypothetical protein